MKIAVLSGKGGTGKTFVSVNLACALKQATYVDCDVEEPNGHLFLKPENMTSTDVSVLLPTFDDTKCVGCRKCVDFCHFNALIYIRKKPIVFSEVCHSCGGCQLVCEQSAISEIEHVIGRVEAGYHNGVRCVTGWLNPGEVSGIPVIEKSLSMADQGNVVVDCPPGSACSVMESISDADVCLLVAEPTMFGFHNFKMVYELATLLHKPCKVIINKMQGAYEPLETFCEENQVDIVARIPYTKEMATLTSCGHIAYEEDEAMKAMFDAIRDEVMA